MASKGKEKYYLRGIVAKMTDKILVTDCAGFIGFQVIGLCC